MKASFEKTMMAVDKKLGVGCLFETMCLFVALAGIALTVVFVLMSPAVFSNGAGAESQAASPHANAAAISVGK